MSTVRQFFEVVPDCPYHTGDIIAMPADNFDRYGYIECDGSYLNTTTYNLLFGVIEYTYGGSGSSFRLPDFRGYFLRGWGGNAGAIGSPQTDSFKSHTHGYYVGPHTGSFHGNQVLRASRNTSYSSTGGPTGSETRPRNMSVRFAIRYI